VMTPPANYDTYTGGVITANYAEDTGSGSAESESSAPVTSVTVGIADGFVDPIVPGSVLFTCAGKTYVDREGSLYHTIDPLTGAGTLAGSIDYSTGVLTITDWGVGGTNNPVVLAMLTRYGQYQVDELAFRTVGVPVLPGLQIRGNRLDGPQVVAEADNNGVITGDFTGTLDPDAGVVLLDFTGVPEPILPDTIRYTGVSAKTLPLEAGLLGLNPVRLPADGRVPMLRVGDIALLHHTETTVLPDPVVADTVYALPRVDIDDVEVRDAEGVLVVDTHYTVDLTAGEIVFPAPLDISEYVEPLTVHDRIEFTGLVDDVQINGLIRFNAPIHRDFPAGSFVSGVLPFNDLQAACPVFFDQTTWTNTWNNTTAGNASASYNTINYPIQLTNADAVTERWALVYTSSSGGNIIGETLGVVGTFTNAGGASPTNPNTGQPYFTLLAAGFGTGWATNNAIRFNTTAAFAPVWVARTILSGAADNDEDSFRIQARGDAN
jgi:hypothetical protein